MEDQKWQKPEVMYFASCVQLITSLYAYILLK